MSEIKLKLCPFCGGEAKLRRINRRIAYVECSKCCAETNHFEMSVEYCATEKAAEAWNQRANQPLKTHWIRKDFTSFDGETIKNGAAICSRCKKAFFMPKDDFDYCPNCGAKIEEAEEHETN